MEYNKVDVKHPKLKKFWDYYDFNRSPDGEDCLMKTYYFTKYAAIGGALFSIYEMALVSKPTTYFGCIGRFGRFTLPCAGMGMMYGSVVCLLGQLRKKNDVPNHVIAGAAAGSIWGVKYGSISAGHTTAVVLGIICGLVKFYTVNKYPMIHMKSPDTDRYKPHFDWSIKYFEDPGRPANT